MSKSVLTQSSVALFAVALAAGCSAGYAESSDAASSENALSQTDNAEFNLNDEKKKKRERFRCRADGDGGREADLRLRVKDGDVEFRAKWEIDKGEGQDVGTVVNVSIDGVFIGGIVLEDDGDQLEGDIEFEDDEFPEDFPEIEEGTPVSIGALFCEFEDD